MNAVKGIVFKVLATRPVLAWGVGAALAFLAAHGIPINDEETKADVVRIVGLILAGGALAGLQSNVVSPATHQAEKEKVGLEVAQRLSPKTVGDAGAIVPTATKVVEKVVNDTAAGLGGFAGGLLKAVGGGLKGVLGG